MDAVTLINQHADGLKLLQYYNFEHINTHGKTIRACCKIHGGDNPTSFVYNPENNLWTCHTGNCGSGNLFQLIMKLENISFPQAVMKASEIFGVDINNLELTTETVTKKETEEWLKLIKAKSERKELKEYTKTYEGKSIKKFRHFTKETLDFFKAVYVEKFNMVNKEGKEYYLRNRILIPIYFKNKLIGTALRRTKKDDIMAKWIIDGFDTKNVLYNYDNCVQYIQENNIDEIILVEGIFDVWSFWQQGIYNVVATFGSHITKEQRKLLLNITSTLVLAYDNDKAGQLCIRDNIQRLKNIFDLYYTRFTTHYN